MRSQRQVHRLTGPWGQHRALIKEDSYNFMDECKQAVRQMHVQTSSDCDRSRQHAQPDKRTNKSGDPKSSVGAEENIQTSKPGTNRRPAYDTFCEYSPN